MIWHSKKEYFLGLLVAVFIIWAIINYRENETSQKVLARGQCSNESYHEKTFIEVNSHLLPKRTWDYDNKTGICVGDDADNCIPGFVKHSEEQIYFYARPAKYVDCLVRKSMSILFKSITCLIDDPLEFFYRQNNLITVGFDRCTDHESRFTGMERASELNISKENGWEYIMITREPLERFISGYMYICIYGDLKSCEHRCNGCGANLTCFLEKETEKLKDRALTYSEVELDLETQHTYPQSWFCELRDNLKDFKFLRFHSDSNEFFDKELEPFLRSRNVSDKPLAYIKDKITSERTEHSTTNSGLKSFIENRIKTSPYLMEMIVRLFYHDYITFDYPFPEVPS